MKKYGLQKDHKEKTGKAWLYTYLVFSVLLLLIALQVSTQTIAYYFGYQQGLGQYLFIAFAIPWYAPWAIFSWVDLNPQVTDTAITYGQLTFIVPQILIAAFWYSFKANKGNENLHGSARWATEKEIKAMGYFNGSGVYVGGWQKGKGKNAELMYLRHNGPEHCLCFAPTRSGKGVGLILPTLLSWAGSSITLDIKGENWALSSGWRKSQGHTVLRFDPSDASGSACQFNPIEELRLDTLFAIQDVQNIAMMMVDPEGKGLADHWTKAAFAFFSGLILHCCVMTLAQKKRSATLQDLTLMLSGHEVSVSELLDEMMSEKPAAAYQTIFPHADPRAKEAAHSFIVSSAAEMKGKAENEASGVLSSALVNMSLYRDPIIALNTAKSDFHIHDLMNSDNPVDLYLVLSPASIDRVRPLIRLITDMIIRRICKDMEFKDGSSVKGYKHRLLLMFDEFTSLGKLPIIEKAIAYIAGYGGKLYLIVQDITQLNSVYGKENALMANCHVRIAYAPNTTETAKVLSEMTGTTTVVEKKTSYSYGKGGKSRSVNIAETARALLTPDECMRLPSAEKDSNGMITRAGHMLIFTAGQSPIYGIQILYFRDPTFMARAQIPVQGLSEKYPAGITDSLYYPRPQIWFDGKQPEKETKTETVQARKSFENYLE